MRAAWVAGLVAGGAALVGGVAYLVTRQAAAVTPPATTTTPVSSTPAVPVAPQIPVAGGGIQPLLPSGPQTVTLDVNTYSTSVQVPRGQTLTIVAPNGGNINTVGGTSVGGVSTYTIPAEVCGPNSSCNLTVEWAPAGSQYSATTQLAVTMV
jgi:hypothetical protein